MSKAIKVFDRDSAEYRKLEFAAAMMSFLDPDNRYWVSNTYFDYGQDWKWTTILSLDNKMNMIYQFLCPRAQEDILNAESIADIEAAVRPLIDERKREAA